MRRFLVIGFLFVACASLKAQPIILNKCYGGTSQDIALSTIQTSDGGFAMAGYTTSNDDEVSGNHGSMDGWVIKLNSAGGIQWQKCVGGSSVDSLTSIAQTSDGGYIVCGSTNSTDNGISGNHGSGDAYVVKLDQNGGVTWQKCFGGSNLDQANSIVQSSDGGYIFCGNTISSDGDITSNHGGNDVWVVKLSSTGTIQWQQCYGGSHDDIGSCIIQTSDGGYALTGSTQSTDGDVTGDHSTLGDVWIVKLNSSGTIQWEHCYGGTGTEWGHSIIETANGYVFTGWAGSTDGDVKGYHNGTDAWVVAINSTGTTIQWSDCLGGRFYDDGYSITQTSDNGYILAGSTESYDGIVQGNHGGTSDAWVVKLKSDGSFDWQRCFGGSAEDHGNFIIQAANGNYVLAGNTYSIDGDLTNAGNHGNSDAWLVEFGTPDPPIIDYITPDAGAPGMCVAVEMVGPTTKTGNFGPDELDTPDTTITHSIRVSFVHPSDSKLVKLGPYGVSWNGRLLQQMFLIEPHIGPIDTEIYFQLIDSAGDASTIDSFRIVSPKHIGALTGNQVLPTTGRTIRNTWVVDSLILTNGIFTFPTSDPDAATNGNQGYLPLRILSLGPIRLNGAILSADGASGVTGTGGGNGGPGGGGGGGGYPGKGGDGFTGGGGDNDNNSGPGGAGTGAPSGTSYDGGSSLSGVVGGFGEQHSSSGGDDGGGGGTGHPFGSSGSNGNNSSSPPGGYGAGSAGGSTSTYTSNYGGGGGGYDTAGSQGQGTGNNGGNVVGNSMLIPLAGGSGGGGGNQTYVSFFGSSDGGCGGGGGGAIELTTFAGFDLANGDIEARGGTGSNAAPGLETAAGGGGGSGGAISISARDSIDIHGAAQLSVTGGAGGTSTSSNSNGGKGGTGRIRINGFVSKTASPSSAFYFTPNDDYTGPSIQKVIYTADSAIVTGYAEYWDGVNSPSAINVTLFLAYTNELSNWNSFFVTAVADPKSHTYRWTASIPFTGIPTDTELYLTAVESQNDLPGTYNDISQFVMSHTSGMISKVVGPPKDSISPPKIDFGDVLVGSCSNDTTITVYSIGKSTLTIDSAKLIGVDASQFKIISVFPQSLNPGTSFAITLQFCPGALKCPDNAQLELFTNIGDTLLNLTGCAVQPQMIIHPLVLNFGAVHVGNCKDSFVIVSNPGKDQLTISSETIVDTHFKFLDTLPITVPALDSVKLHLEFCPTDTPERITYDTVVGDAPQSPIAVLLKGSGKIGILSMPDTLDFGLVHFDSCKDTTFYAKNVGNDSLTLEIASIQPGDFSYVSPHLPYVLKAHDSVAVDLRFCSHFIGVSENYLYLTSYLTTTDTAISATDTTVLFAHTGIGILQMPNVIDFGNVTTGGCADTIVQLQNIGTDTLTLAPGTNFSPPFSYVGPAKIVIAPGSSVSVTLQFCPKDTNEATETTQFDTIGIGKNQTFILRGKGIQGALSTSGAVNVGCLVLDSSETETIKISNTGSATLQNVTALGTPAGSVTIVHNPPATLASGASDSVVVLVSGQALGNLSGSVTLDWKNGTSLTVPITAEVSPPPALVTLGTVPIVFDSTNTGDSSSSKCISVTNYSCVPLPINQITISGADPGSFEIISNSTGATIADSVVATICLKYKPQHNGNASATLNAISNGTTIPIATLSGTGIGKSVGVELAIDTVAGVPGQTVNVPIRTWNDVTAADLTTVDFRVTFNPMQLALKTPIVAPATWSIQSAATPTYSVIQHSYGDQEITATFPTPLTGKPIIARLPFEILEPTANTAPIHLQSATFGTSLSTLSTAADGLVQIEQCDTNSSIAFMPSAIDVAPNNPNPFSSSTSIAITVHTAGHVKLEIYNALGARVLVPFDADVSVGTENIVIDASKLLSGAYRYVTTWTLPPGVTASKYQPLIVRDEKTMVRLAE